MKTRESIELRIEQCESRSKEYMTKAQRCRIDEAANYWLEQSATQDEIAHALKWVLEDSWPGTRKSCEPTPSRSE